MKKILFTVAFLFSTLVVVGQSPLQAKVSFKASGFGLEEVLLELTRLSGAKISFASGIIPKTESLTLDYQNISLEECLKRILTPHGLGFELVGNQIVVFKKPEAELSRRFTISGFVEDAMTGERLINANIFNNKTFQGTVTNGFGFFSLTLQTGTIGLRASYLGYQLFEQEVFLDGNQFLIIKLTPNLTLSEVIVTATRSSELSASAEETFPLVNAVKKLPTIGGEPDILQTANKIAGIQSGADGIGGLNVRGGSSDQNLILLDDAVVYNPTHSWGVYSIFNTNAIQSFDLKKSGFPSRFGGRLSSVMEVRTKNGNNRDYEGDIEVGLVSTKATVEGPIVKEKASFLVSVRRAHPDLFSVPFYRKARQKDGVGGTIRYYFYDLNLKLNYTPNKKDKFYLSLYNGKDLFNDQKSIRGFAEDTIAFYDEEVDQNWGNTIAGLRWNRTWSSKLFGNTTLTYSRFFYQSKNLSYVEAFKRGEKFLDQFSLSQFNSNIEDLTAKSDFYWYHTPALTFRFGVQASKYNFQPGVISVAEDVFSSAATYKDSLIVTLDTFWQRSKIEALAYFAYAETQFDFFKNGVCEIGLHSGVFGVGVKKYWTLQPRIQIGWDFGKRIKAGANFDRMTQFLNLLSTSTIGLPNDIWVAATKKIKPQEATQLTLWTKIQLPKDLEILLEAYHKDLDNLIEFQAPTTVLVNASNWEESVVTGTGEALGVELQIHKKWRFIRSWFNYAYAHSNRQFEGINFDETFPFRYDRRHDFNANFTATISKNWELSAAWEFSTGIATSLPVGSYVALPGISLPPFIIYTFDSRNGFRLPNYHHLDIGFTYKWQTPKGENAVSGGIYNLYFRKNPIYYELREANQYYQRFLPPFLPSLSCRFKI